MKVSTLFLSFRWLECCTLWSPILNISSVGNIFRILTEHISNSWVQNLKHSHGRLALEPRVQNYTFKIEHLPGKKMPSDFLSCTVDVKDDKAADLDDDSALVFTVGSTGDRNRNCRRAGRIPTR